MSEVQPSRTPQDLRRAEAAYFARLACRDLNAAAALTAGWSRRQLIDVALTLAVAQPPPAAQTPPHVLKQWRRINEAAWSDAEVRAAHSAWNGGERSRWAEDGERLYHRLRKRRLRQQSRRAS